MERAPSLRWQVRGPLPSDHRLTARGARAALPLTGLRAGRARVPSDAVRGAQQPVAGLPARPAGGGVDRLGNHTVLTE
eukprot:1454874-Prymnesium_polylepis.1